MLQTLELLSECQEIHMIMWKELGLVLSLNQMMEAVSFGGRRWQLLRLAACWKGARARARNAQ